MTTLIKKITYGLASTALAGTFLFLPQGINTVHAKSSNAASVQHVQLISDQQTVGSGGYISYHLLYHHVENKNASHTWLKVKVPQGLEIDQDDLKGAKWDKATRTLLWDLKAHSKGKGDDRDADKGSGVIHFKLKVKGDVPVGTRYDLYGILEQDGKVIFKTPNVNIQTGTEIHQPFFTGYPDGKFHPQSSITRAEVAAVVARIKNLKDSSSHTRYSDVPQSHWAYKVIHQVTNAGYMKGYRGEFNPDEPISRAELTSLILRIRGIEAIDLNTFEDSNKHWAKKDIATAKALKYISGTDDKNFDPDGSTERQVAAKLFDIALFRGPLLDGKIPVKQHFPDVDPDDWAFPWVEEASVEAHESVHKGNGEQLIRYLPNQTRSF
ncbi:S-layer homology domain-containing protein [Ammoniphilus sp. 3BR4]|uniref:S-layer homology domain-containing protein n=1 Tax=Ammoniphilus sp. 3BR4 TaxID=3158265 RepID=UPI003466A459